MKLEDYIIITKLVKEKKYNDIYMRYGKKCFLEFTPYSYQKSDIGNLLKNGKFLDIYEKYSITIYNKYLNQMRKIDIQNELGNNCFKYVIFENLKSKLKLIKKNTILGLATLSTLSVCFTAQVSASIDKIIKNNSIQYEKEIDDYNNEITKYAEYINSLNLNDLEIIIKVIDDMWSNIDGYKTPSNYDILGYQRLSLYIDGYGVCRNMADDFTARINAINSDYEACNLYVLISDAQINNIQRNIINENNTINQNNQENNSNYKDEFTKELIGNHLVTCMKLKDDNAIVIVDPTNPSIGLYQNGKVYMFSNTKNGIETKSMGNILFGIENRINCLKKLKDSYIINNNYNYLNNKYNIENQNKVLTKIKEHYSSDNYNIY